MTSDIARQMLHDVLEKCYEGGIYVPVVSFDGQWFKLAVRSAFGKPLTLLQLMKDVFQKAKSTKKSDILKVIKETNVVKASSQTEAFSAVKHQVKITENGQILGAVDLYRANQCQSLFCTSSSALEALHNHRSSHQKSDLHQEVCSSNASGKESFNLLDEIPASVVDEMDDHTICSLNHNVSVLPDTTATIEVDVEGVESIFLENSETDVNTERSVDDMCTESQNLSISDATEVNVTEDNYQIGDTEMSQMLSALQLAKRQKWKKFTLANFKGSLKCTDSIEEAFQKAEIVACLNAVSEPLTRLQLTFRVSWKKEKLVDFLYQVVTDSASMIPETARKTKRRLYSLKQLCSMELSRFPKDVLNVVYAEHLYPTEEQLWRQSMNFSTPTIIEGLDRSIEWYSKPEYVQNRYTYQFSLLDCHHLFTNARIKCCSTGIARAGIKKEAWSKVARESSKNHTGLSRALVEDLVDRQSNTYAQKTFSLAVEEAMQQNGDMAEAYFCKLIREWYQAEDDPGLDSIERCRRRLRLRDWLMGQITTGKFPPPGSHVNGIPIVMFEGLMTNIERRIQLFPYVKKGTYNVRACGSLENENFFGEFQDLDPKGSGVLRPSSVPAAISTACELIQARYDPNRLFYMHTSRSKVYQVHELEKKSECSRSNIYITPDYISSVQPRNHVFDLKERGERKRPKRKSGDISQPAVPCRGEQPIRQHHRCDESKILPHIRMGLDNLDFE